MLTTATPITSAAFPRHCRSTDGGNGADDWGMVVETTLLNSKSNNA